MKLVNQILAFLLISLFLCAACSEETNLAKVPQPERLAKAYLQGQMPNLEGAGMMNILPPNDSLRYAFESDLELKSREVARAQLLLAAEGEWTAMNKMYRDCLAESKTSPHAWYEQQVLANQALYQLFVHFPKEIRNPEDVIFYTNTLLVWESANAWRMAQTLTYLQDYWSDEQIREAALICLNSTALPVVEELRKQIADDKTMPFLRDMMNLHLAGLGILHEYAEVKN